MGRRASKTQCPDTLDRYTDPGTSFITIDILTQKRSPWLLLFFICIASSFPLLHQDSRVIISLDPITQEINVVEVDQSGPIPQVLSRGELQEKGSGARSREGVAGRDRDGGTKGGVPAKQHCPDLHQRHTFKNSKSTRPHPKETNQEKSSKDTAKTCKTRKVSGKTKSAIGGVPHQCSSKKSGI